MRSLVGRFTACTARAPHSRDDVPSETALGCGVVTVRSAGKPRRPAQKCAISMGFFPARRHQPRWTEPACGRAERHGQVCDDLLPCWLPRGTGTRCPVAAVGGHQRSSIRDAGVQLMEVLLQWMHTLLKVDGYATVAPIQRRASRAVTPPSVAACAETEREQPLRRRGSCSRPPLPAPSRARPSYQRKR